MIKKHFISASLLFASLVLVGAGCGQQASVSVNTSANAHSAPADNGQPPAATAPKPTPELSADACGNPYFSLKPGLAITYGITSSAHTSANNDYTLRVISVSGGTATLRTEMANGVTADIQASCTGGTVTLNGSVDAGAAAQGAKFKTTVVSSSGTYMPSDVAVGSTWTNSQTAKMEATSGPTVGMGAITSTTDANSKAVGEESVTVPAGTYTALKVEETRTTTVQLSGGMPAGIKLPPGMKPPTVPPTTSTSTQWWVKGLGMVKTVTVTNGATMTIEAKSVTGQ